MLSAEAIIGLAALVVMCLPALGYVLRAYTARVSSRNSQGRLIYYEGFRHSPANKKSADTQDVEKTAEDNISFKVPHPTTCRSCSMQFESHTYYHEVCALSSACTRILADHDEATCVMRNDIRSHISNKAEDWVPRVSPVCHT
jgi:hypothetical protein